MKDRCIIIDGSRVRVTDKFDTTEGSADMVSMRNLLKILNELGRNEIEQLRNHDCHSAHCDYQEPHRHGFACGPQCICSLGMKASKS